MSIGQFIDAVLDELRESPHVRLDTIILGHAPMPGVVLRFRQRAPEPDPRKVRWYDYGLTTLDLATKDVRLLAKNLARRMEDIFSRPPD